MPPRPVEESGGTGREHAASAGSADEQTNGNEERLMAEQMETYECVVCGYIYDPKVGDPTAEVAPGVGFDALPDDWVCPECMVGQDQFVKVQA